MTRSMNSRLDCPTCRCQMSMETHFERWVRENNLLDSRAGIVRFDIDVLLHRYMEIQDGFGKRDIQALMFIEVKTWGAQLQPSQLDTLNLLNQVLRNRKPNIHANNNECNAKDHVPLAKAKSLLLGKDVCLKMLGGHSLRFEKNGPDDSTWIKWGTPRKGSFDIDKEQLTDLILFRLDPDDPRIKLDIRRRSKSLPLLDRAP